MGRHKPVQHDQQHTASRGESLKSGLGEGIRLEFSVLVSSDEVLFLLDITVQDREIQIGRGLVYAGVAVVGLEDI